MGTYLTVLFIRFPCSLITRALFCISCIVFLCSARLRFLGKVLLVERANKPTEDDKQKSEALFGKDLTKPVSLIKDFTMAGDLSEGLKSSSLPASEPIAARLGIDYPFPPHLEYVSFSLTIFSVYFFLAPLSIIRETGL